MTDEDEIIIVTGRSQVVRFPVNQIRTIGRNTQGVRVIKLGPKDKVASAMKVVARGEAGEDSEDKSSK